jgi:hypothetical protein
MKKAMVALTVVALAGASIQTVRAGGCGWSTTGKVLAGVTAGLVIGQALAPRTVYYTAPAPVYYSPPTYTYSYAAPARRTIVYTAPAPVVYAAPAPVVVYRRPVYVAPPVVSVSFGNCGYRRGCR